MYRIGQTAKKCHSPKVSACHCRYTVSKFKAVKLQKLSVCFRCEFCTKNFQEALLTKLLGGGTWTLLHYQWRWVRRPYLKASGLQVMNIATKTTEIQSQNLVQMLQQSPHPNLGKTLDIVVWLIYDYIYKNMSSGYPWALSGFSFGQ